MKNNPQHFGPGGNCVCSKCGFKQPHRRGIPCQEEHCPECNGKMVRENSPDHRKIMEAKKKKGRDIAD